jgi:hypothetical protein
MLFGPSDPFAFPICLFAHSHCFDSCLNEPCISKYFPNNKYFIGLLWIPSVNKPVRSYTERYIQEPATPRSLVFIAKPTWLVPKTRHAIRVVRMISPLCCAIVGLFERSLYTSRGIGTAPAQFAHVAEAHRRRESSADREGAWDHSMTSSAVCCSRKGISTPIAFAVLRFTTSSYLVGC